MTKKIWNLLRVFYLTARKGISRKTKLLLDLRLMLKRGKIAGKALIGNLSFHTHRHQKQPYSSAPVLTFSAKGEYEFSCSNTPAHQAMFNLIHLHLPTLHVGGNKHGKGNKNIRNKVADGMDCPDLFLDDESYEAVSRVLDALAIQEGNQGAAGSLSSASSLNLPASYYSSPATYNLQVRQLRVTDSPFPLANNDEDDRHVDEAAEEFISRFYNQLKQQTLTPSRHGAEW